MYYTKEFIDHVRDLIHSQPMPPIYNPEEWSQNPRDFNCYAYALQIKMSLFDIEFKPGFTTGELVKRRDYTPEFILEKFFIDCENLGLNVTETTVDEEINDNEYKIAVYYIKGFSFHFAWQDKKGIWSHKHGWLDPIMVIEGDISENIGMSKFIGVFRISKKKE